MSRVPSNIGCGFILTALENHMMNLPILFRPRLDEYLPQDCAIMKFDSLVGSQEILLKDNFWIPFQGKFLLDVQKVMEYGFSKARTFPEIREIWLFLPQPA
jgi:hypothetical protein